MQITADWSVVVTYVAQSLAPFIKENIAVRKGLTSIF